MLKLMMTTFNNKDCFLSSDRDFIEGLRNVSDDHLSEGKTKPRPHPCLTQTCAWVTARIHGTLLSRRFFCRVQDADGVSKVCFHNERCSCFLRPWFSRLRVWPDCLYLLLWGQIRRHHALFRIRLHSCALQRTGTDIQGTQEWRSPSTPFLQEKWEIGHWGSQVIKNLDQIQGKACSSKISPTDSFKRVGACREGIRTPSTSGEVSRFFYFEQCFQCEQSWTHQKMGCLSKPCTQRYFDFAWTINERCYLRTSVFELLVSESVCLVSVRSEQVRDQSRLIENRFSVQEPQCQSPKR